MSIHIFVNSILNYALALAFKNTHYEVKNPQLQLTTLLIKIYMKNMFFFFLCLLHNNYLYYSFLFKKLMEKKNENRLKTYPIHKSTKS